MQTMPSAGNTTAPNIGLFGSFYYEFTWRTDEVGPYRFGNIANWSWVPSNERARTGNTGAGCSGGQFDCMVEVDFLESLGNGSRTDGAFLQWDSTGGHYSGGPF